MDWRKQTYTGSSNGWLHISSLVQFVPHIIWLQCKHIYLLMESWLNGDQSKRALQTFIDTYEQLNSHRGPFSKSTLTPNTEEWNDRALEMSERSRIRIDLRKVEIILLAGYQIRDLTNLYSREQDFVEGGGGEDFMSGHGCFHKWGPNHVFLYSSMAWPWPIFPGQMGGGGGWTCRIPPSKYATAQHCNTTL